MRDARYADDILMCTEQLHEYEGGYPRHTDVQCRMFWVPTGTVEGVEGGDEVVGGVMRGSYVRKTMRGSGRQDYLDLAERIVLALERFVDMMREKGY